jgi:hypothetical protein
LKYILSHGVKERLVKRPQDWPGAHSVRALMSGTVVRGVWFSRTREFAFRRSGDTYRPRDFAKELTFSLAKLPCWVDASDQSYRQHVRDLCRDIQAEHRTTDAIRAPKSLPPNERPTSVKKSPTPWFHCASRAVRRQLHEAYALFHAAYRRAARLLEEGDLSAPFPIGSFPRPRPFIAE